MMIIPDWLSWQFLKVLIFYLYSNFENCGVKSHAIIKKMEKNCEDSEQSGLNIAYSWGGSDIFKTLSF